MSLGKKDIVKDIISKADLSKKDSEIFLEAFIRILKSQYSKINISNFGVFYKHKSPKRVGRNPKTKKVHIISERVRLNFKSSNKLKKAIN